LVAFDGGRRAAPFEIHSASSVRAAELTSLQTLKECPGATALI
jgi:hypothetical protein